MKRKHHIQNHPIPEQTSASQGVSSNKSNAMLANQLQSLVQESSISPPQAPKLNIEQVRQFYPSLEEVSVPIPELSIVESAGLEPQEVSVPIPDCSSGSSPQTTPQAQTPSLNTQTEDKTIPDVTVPIPDLPKIGLFPQEVTVPIPNMEVTLPVREVPVQETPIQEETPISTSPSNPEQESPTPSAGGGRQVHKVLHDFNNQDNHNISLTYTGGIQSVVAESKTARDGLLSTGREAKHYTITFFNDLQNLHITPGDEAAAGSLDSGIVVAKVEKIAPKQFKVWFNRAKGPNTYVNEFSIDG